MNSGIEKYADGPKTVGLGLGALSPVQESQRQRLERTKQDCLSIVADIDRAIALLEKYPEIEELQDLLRRI